MTNRQDCPPREDLVLLLYDEGEPTERRQLEAHLSTCTSCRGELDALGGVRRVLSAWEAPDLRPHVRLVADPPPTKSRPWAWLLHPAFPLAAAAALVLGVAAGLANLDVSYGTEGLSVRTGWGPRTGVPDDARRPEPTPALTSTPWRGDLDRLEAQLRQEFAEPVAVTPTTVSSESTAAAATNAALLARIERLINESEVRQQRNLALRVAELSRDFDLQRRADLVRIQQGLGETQADAARTREMMNYFMRVSQQSPR